MIMITGMLLIMGMVMNREDLPSDFVCNDRRQDALQRTAIFAPGHPVMTMKMRMIKKHCESAKLFFLSFFVFFPDITMECLKGLNSQVSKVALCVKIQKWQSLTQWLSQWARSGIELPGQLKTKWCRLSWKWWWRWPEVSSLRGRLGILAPGILLPFAQVVRCQSSPPIWQWLS